MTVTVKSGIKSSNILVRDIPEDQIFTQYGGTAKFEDLIEGDEVRIWSKDCRPAKKSALKAAAMIVFK